MPGKIIQCLKKTKTENPLILIDEVKYLVFLLGFALKDLYQFLIPVEKVKLLKIPSYFCLNEAGLSGSLSDTDTLDALFSLLITDSNFKILVVSF